MIFPESIIFSLSTSEYALKSGSVAKAGSRLDASTAPIDLRHARLDSI
jgi:hypothetical protein